MSGETLDSYIRQLLEPHDASHVTVAWQGGEPILMGLEFLLVKKERERIPRSSTKRPWSRMAASLEKSNTQGGTVSGEFSISIPG